MKLVILLASLAGLSIALQATMNASAGRTLGLPVLIAFSGFATGLGGLGFALLASSKPEFSVRAVAFGIGSGLLGCVILACVTYAVGQGGVARALSLVIAAQLIAGLVLDRLGVFGDGVALSPVKVLGVVLIIVGGVLVVRF
ncbi:MAG: DMT family transporter [Rubrobacter sp.]